MMDSQSPLEEAARWFAVLRRNVMTIDERKAFETWSAEPENRAALARVENTWDKVGRLAADEVPPEPKAFRPSRRGLLFAGGAAVAASAAIGIARFTSGLPWAPGVRSGAAETGIGEQKEFTLPDGSIIRLNALSRLRWQLAGDDRRVVLDSGDALFTVAKDAGRPFSVKTGSGAVKVLGTIFSVSVRDSGTSVAVREGRVAVAPRSGEPVNLLAGDAVRFSDRGAAPVTSVSPEQVGEWSEHFITFEHTPLAEVAGEMGRYFPVRVRIDPPAAADRRITLRLKLRDQKSTLDLLGQLLAARVELGVDSVVLHVKS